VLLVITPGEKCGSDGSAKDGERLEVSVFPPSPQGLRRGKQCSPLPLRFRRDYRFAPTGLQYSVFFVFLTPET